ncbi:MAG: bacterioferritin [Planctomycetaceae bacterium]|nr:bacterioferritin [Planctomycetaceae bacterium]
MKGNDKVIEAMNAGLTIELTAINQYFIQSKMCRDWGYNKLAKYYWDESMEEMQHADLLIDRILFLEGVPEIARYDVIRVGKTVVEQLENGLKLELGAVAAYNDAIKLAMEQKDAGSKEIMEKILVESEESVDWLETQLSLVKEVGLQNYLAMQMGETAEG